VEDVEPVSGSEDVDGDEDEDEDEDEDGDGAGNEDGQREVSEEKELAGDNTSSSIGESPLFSRLGDFSFVEIPSFVFAEEEEGEWETSPVLGFATSTQFFCLPFVYCLVPPTELGVATPIPDFARS
jgi:hypothetical protein